MLVLAGGLKSLTGGGGKAAVRCDDRDCVATTILAIMDDLASFHRETVIRHLGDLGNSFAGITVYQQKIRLFAGGDSAAIVKVQKVGGVAGRNHHGFAGRDPDVHHVGKLKRVGAVEIERRTGIGAHRDQPTGLIEAAHRLLVDLQDSPRP